MIPFPITPQDRQTKDIIRCRSDESSFDREAHNESLMANYNVNLFAQRACGASAHNAHSFPSNKNLSKLMQDQRCMSATQSDTNDLPLRHETGTWTGQFGREDEQKETFSRKVTYRSRVNLQGKGEPSKGKKI